MCGNYSTLGVHPDTHNGYLRYCLEQDIYIQDIPVPDKKDYRDQARVREFLKTGYCPDCMKLLFG